MGADSSPKRFHFKTHKDDEIDEIRGTYDDAITPKNHPELFKRYKARITVIETIHYATEQQDVKYHLEELIDVGDSRSHSGDHDIGEFYEEEQEGTEQEGSDSGL